MFESSVFLYLATVLIWGSTWFAIKFQLGVVAPGLSIAYRCGLSALLLFAYAMLRGLRLRFAWREHAFFILEGVLLFSLNYLCIYHATLQLTSGLVAVLFSVLVLMNALNAAIFFRQRVGMDFLFGAGLGFAGILLVFWPDLQAFDLARAGSSGSIMACLLGAYLASLGNMVALRNQRSGLPILQTNAFGMLYGALMLVGWASLQGTPFRYDESPAYTFSLLYLALFGTVIAFGTYMSLLGRIGPARAAYATVLFPVVALALSTLFEGYVWTGLSLAGVVLVVFGNVLTVSRNAMRQWVGVVKYWFGRWRFL